MLFIVNVTQFYCFTLKKPSAVLTYMYVVSKAGPLFTSKRSLTKQRTQTS